MRAKNIMYNAICTGEGDTYSPKNVIREAVLSAYARNWDV
jgi:hypothetical protein